MPGSAGGRVLPVTRIRRNKERSQQSRGQIATGGNSDAVHKCNGRSKVQSGGVGIVDDYSAEHLGMDAAGKNVQPRRG